MKKKGSIFLIIVILLLISSIYNVQALDQQNRGETESADSSETIEELVHEMQDQWEGIRLGESSITFSDCVKNGEESGMFKSSVKMLITGISNELSSQKEGLAQLFFLGVMSAFFVDFSNHFLREYLGETGYLAIYVMMFTVILNSFQQIYLIGKEAIAGMMDSVLVITPVYVNALMMAGKYQTAMGYYAFLMGGIGVIEWLVKDLLLPVIFFYFILQMLNYSMQEDRFVKLAEFLRKTVLWVLRFLFGLVTGMQVVQCLLLPVTDQAQASNFAKSLAAIPGLGASARALTSTVLNSALVVKNAVGVAVMLFFVLVIAMPCIKLFLFILAYQLIAALLQPIAQKRVANLLAAAASGAKLLFQALVTCAGLFLIGIVIVTAATSGVG